MDKYLNDEIYDILKYEFSPLEQVLYLYDTIIDSDEDIDTKVNMFNRALNLFEIKNTVFDDKVNAIYLKDKKYDINGVYQIDLDKEYDSDIYSRYDFLGLNNTVDYGNQLNKNDAIIFDELADDINKIPSGMIKRINDISLLISNKLLIYNTNAYSDTPVYSFNKHTVLSDLQKFINLLNKRICATSLIQALYNVRKVECYVDYNRYPFSKEDFIKTVLSSNWKFNSRTESLLYSLFHITLDVEQEAYEFFDQNDYERKINGVKLSKLLAMVLDEKIDNENNNRKFITKIKK